MLKLTENLNTFLEQVSSNKSMSTKKLGPLFTNLVKISSDLRSVTDRLGTEEGKQVWEKLYKILNRLEKIDGALIRKFAQEEGIKTHVDF